MERLIAVELVYATAQTQIVQRLKVPAGATLRGIIERSGILQRFPELNPEQMQVGVYGRLRALDAEVQAGERVEIYRALLVDPKTARRHRAARAKKTQS